MEIEPFTELPSNMELLLFPNKFSGYKQLKIICQYSTLSPSGNIVYFQPSLFTPETYSDIIVNEIQSQKAWQGKYFNPYEVP